MESCWPFVGAVARLPAALVAARCVPLGFLAALSHEAVARRDSVEAGADAWFPKDRRKRPKDPAPAHETAPEAAPKPQAPEASTPKPVVFAAQRPTIGAASGAPPREGAGAGGLAKQRDEVDTKVALEQDAARLATESQLHGKASCDHGRLAEAIHGVDPYADARDHFSLCTASHTAGARRQERCAASSALLEPVVLGGLALRSRVVHPAMQAGRCPGGLVGPLAQRYYQQRTGCGLLVTEPTAVAPDGFGAKDAPALYTEEHSQAWYPVTRQCREDQCTVVCALWHAGRLAHPSFGRVLGPSAIKAEPTNGIPLPGVLTQEGLWADPVEPSELTEADIREVVEEFGQSAKLAVMAGFHGVEIHAGWGGLLDTFLQSSTNRRTDAYGGTWQKRFQLLFEVLQRVAMELPLSKVGVRWSPNSGFNGMGSSDNFICFPKFAQSLQALGVAYLHAQDGLGDKVEDSWYSGVGFHNRCAPLTLRKLRQAAPPLIGSGGFQPAQAAMRIDEDDAEAIAFGRLCLSNPDLCQRIRRGWPLSPPPRGLRCQEAVLPEHGLATSLEMGYTDYPCFEG